jgi:polo-like kinase 1
LTIFHRNVQYITREGKEFYYLMEKYPGTLDKKMKLLSYFCRYMSEHFVKAGATVHVQECDSLSRVPHLNQWFNTSSAVVMLLTNGTLQVRSSGSLALLCFLVENICP